MQFKSGGQKGFHIVDYVIFALTMVVSLGIGIYFAIGGRNKTNEEYLMGNRGLKTVPVAISMLVTFVTAVGMLGTPAEMYAFGTQFVMHIIAASLGCIYGAVLFVPLLYPLKLTSSFEYFELRFRSIPCKLVGSIITLLNIVFMNGTGLYAPSMALEAVTGFPIWVSMVLCGVVTTAYTSLGGMKAVIWTDVFQSVIILGGLIAVCIVGTIKVGGFQAVWDLNDKWDRIEFFNFNPDPRERVTFWSIVVMMSILWMCMTVAQPAVQRYCSLPSMTKAKIAVLLNIPGFVIVGILACFGGVIAFAYYAKVNCDPMTGGQITNPNQILPYFVMDVIGYPGLPGVFVACLYSGALSTVSSSLNAAAAITWEDLLKWKWDYLPDNKKTIILKVIALLYGVASLGMGFALEHISGTFVQIVFSVLGTTLGPIVGMYFLGASVPAAGPKGCLIGVMIGLTLSVWMAVGAYVKKIHSRPLPLPWEACENIQGMLAGIMAGANATDISIGNATVTGNATYALTGNATANATAPMSKEQALQQLMGAMMKPPPELHGIEHMYAVSYLWYPVVGIVVVMLVGIITSCIPGLRQPNRTPKKYLFPVLRPLARCCQRYAYDGYDDDDDLDYKDEKPTQLQQNLIYRPPGPTDKNKNYKDAQNGRGVKDNLLVDSRESNM